ncbi:hypothetical protein Forpe1208_v002708 [Fusarium oxysporum f. sp. rapae]|uniref:AMP-activated protein kinase glycogen-binding domain-containing protein n=1 Tax=Fusarium oxysporum f. sp. rapae TaxID=485398 RepID=A0A8J5TWP7_FUSOX|nr:hypothetical protein Forpe1208_v002708 [Fusarium oxysporum f. sp. rapae]
MSSKTPCTITYKKPGTSPPVFLAGSFTDPQWQLQEMEYTTDQNGDHIFQSEVMLEPDQDYQFKLRIGHDNWALAENYPTATDDSGNQNNVIRAPEKPAEEQIAPAGVDTPAINLNPASQLPSISTEAESVGENAEDFKVPLFVHESLGNDVEEETEDNKIPLLAHETLGDESKEEDEAEAFKAPLLAHETLGNDAKEDSEEMKMPLFAHECLGAYDFGEEPDSAPIAVNSPGQSSRAKSKHDESSDIDVNDPTLETFPSDRGSILDTIRTIQTHLGEDQTHLEDIPLSPRVISSRRTSLDSNDDLCLSPASLSPTVTRRRDSRPSHSFGRTRSLVSLGSIEEEPKPASSKQSAGPDVVSLPNPNSKSKPVGQKSPPSEEDEAVVMKTPEVKPSTKTNGESASQVESYEAQNTQHDKAFSATTAADTPVAAVSQAIDSPSNDTPSIGKSVQNKSSGIPESEAVQSSKEPQPTPDPIIDNKTKKTAAPGDPSRAPPRGSVVPLIVTTGALAVAIGIGWWQAADH